MSRINVCLDICCQLWVPIRIGNRIKQRVFQNRAKKICGIDSCKLNDTCEVE